MSKFQSYKLFYESYGYNFLLEDLIIQSYIQWDTLVISEKDHVRKYIPEQVIVQLKKSGNNLTVGEIHIAESNIQKLISILSQQEIERENIEKNLSIFSEILNYYSIFDTTYSEGIFERDSKDMRLVAIENSKNKLREGFDSIFFGEDSLLEKVLGFIAKEYKVSLDKIHFYQLLEIYDLIKHGTILSESEINNRKIGYVFDRDSGGIQFYSGKKALDLLNFLECRENGDINLQGAVAFKADHLIQGKVYVLHRDHSNNISFTQEMEKMPEGSVLVTTMTDPEFLPAMKKSFAILTQTGGQLSHASISAREFKIPCIVGINNLLKTLKTGDIVDVDTNTGFVRIIK